MKMTIYSDDFHNAFYQAQRENNFTYAGRQALFEYIEEYELSTGEEIELDVISLCCEFDEYTSVSAFVEEYGSDSWRETLTELQEEHGDDESAIRDAFLEQLQGHTQVIDVDGEGFIVAVF